MTRLTKSGTKFQIRRDSTKAYLTVVYNGKRADVAVVTYGDASPELDFDEIEQRFNDAIPEEPEEETEN